MRHRTAASLLALGLGLVEASSSSFAATPRPAPGPAERSPAPTNAGVTADAAQPEEVNVASSARGATAAGAGGGTSDLLALIDESNGTAAALTPDQKTGNSVTTINLADTTDVTRVALEVGDQRGQLRVYAVDAGAATDFRVALDSAKLVSSFSLDGSRNTVTADLGNTPVKTLALVWVPDTPGTSLSVSNVAVFTRTPPPAAALG
ncbi:MAG: hypothetical protein HZC55_03080, partial [Verrucomicrobia bacterium]|nr:hypothetical protein [Verrucomicrobiota bacterium]